MSSEAILYIPIALAPGVLLAAAIAYLKVRHPERLRVLEARFRGDPWAALPEETSPVAEEVRQALARPNAPNSMPVLQRHVASVGFNQCVQVVASQRRYQSEMRYCEAFVLDSYGIAHTMGQEVEGTRRAVMLEESAAALARDLGVEFHRL